MPFKPAALTALPILCLTAPCVAQETAVPLVVPDAQPNGPAAAPGLSVRLGAGALAVPDYLGSRTYRAQPLPYVDASYGGLADLSYQDGLTVNTVRAGGLTAGPVARVRFGQDEKDNRRVLRGLGNVGTALEVGAFSAYDAGPINLRAVVAQDVAGGHKGLVAEFGATYTQAVFGTEAGPWLLTAGPTLTVVDRQYNRSYFGVNTAQSLRSGRAIYRPGGGLESIAVSATLVVPLTEKIAVTALAGYSRLLSDAARSPLVRAGSANQVTGGLFLTYQIH